MKKNTKKAEAAMEVMHDDAAASASLVDAAVV
jgi:hypothetical protein